MAKKKVHLLPVNLSPVDDERSVTNRVNHALFLALGIEEYCGASVRGPQQ